MIKIARGLNAFRRDANHALCSPTALRRRFAHPGFEEAFCLEPVDGCVDRPDRALLAGVRLDRFAYSRAVSVVAQPRRRGNQQVFKLTKHNKHIVRLMQSACQAS